MKPHNTEDQTTHVATKTHKIKQHVKPQKHIRSNKKTHKIKQKTHEATQHMNPQKHTR